MSRPGASFAVLLVMLAVCPVRARAQWIPQGRAVSSSVGSHGRPVLMPDGAGGAYVVWQYGGPSPQEVLVSHVLANGGAGAGFGALGSPVSASSGPRFLVGAGVDGSGGVVVGWRVGNETRAQRFQSDGSPATGWGANGNPMPLPDDPRAMTVDGQGGGWFRFRSDDQICPDICYESSATLARHFDGSGVLNPADFSIAVSNHQFGSDGAVFPAGAGAALAWGYDGWTLNGAVKGLNAAAQLAWTHPLDMSHVVVWAALPDGAGGGLFVTEGALGSSPPRLLRIDSNGALHAGFPADGASIRIPDATMGSLVAAPVESGSILVAWSEPVGGFAEVRVQKLTGAGAIAAGWPADGRVVCAAAGGRDQVVMASDGAGGAFLAWHDRRDEQAGDVYAHHVFADGTLDPAFVPNGTGIATVSGGADQLTIAAVANGTAMLAWTDFRTFSEIRAQMLPLPGSAGVESATHGLSLAGFVPNPAAAMPRVTFALAGAGDVTLELFDLAGRRVHAERWTALAAGPHQLALAPARPLVPGLYLIRVRAGGEQVVRRGMVGR